jgi:serine/threonine protein kinase
LLAEDKAVTPQTPSPHSKTLARSRKHPEEPTTREGTERSIAANLMVEARPGPGHLPRVPELTISHYRVLSPLGAGGMGEVFLAEDTRLDRKVALKLLPAEVARDPVRRQRFITEAKAASALTHPNVCVIHEVGETEDGRLFLTMEYVEGCTLDARIRQGALPLEEIVAIGVQATDALEAAHAKGIIHRDIKPSNICLNQRGQVKVLDFGLAKRLTQPEGVDLEVSTRLQTQSGQVLGTPHYMSPEQALGKEVDARSDLFSLGIVLYELSTGKTPFAGTSLADTLDRILHAQPEAMARLNYNVTPELERIVRKCLEKQSARRYQSARELLVDLRNLQRDLSGGSAALAATRIEPTPPLLAAASPAPGTPALGGGGLAAAGPLPSVEAMRDSDLFLAYASIDDQPMLQGRQGWVSQFCRNLELRLEQLSGERVKIWCQANPPGSGPVDERVLQHVPQVKTFVSVVSPPFAKSDGCRREVEAFWQTAERTGSLRVENKSRLFKVVKTPVDQRELPPHLAGLFKQLLDHDFFEIDPATGRLREFSEEFGEDARRVFLEKVYDLAYEINQVLKACKTVQIPRVVAPTALSATKVVFLAETTSDLRGERDRLRRELQERGFEVLPDAPLPLVADELVAAVRAHLNRAHAAIHLVGPRYGMIPEGGQESLVAMQARLSAEAFHAKPAGRFIWSPPELKPEDERQAAFVRALHESSEAMEGTELLSGSLEQLKGLVVKHLTAPPPPPKQPVATTPDEVRRIYLICDRQDEQAIEPLEDFLYDQGFEVKVPIFEGEEEAFLQIHQENLKLADAVIVFFGQASAQWVEMKLMDLLKAPGYGRTKPWLAQAVYLAPPEHRRKERFRTRSAEVIRESGGFAPGLLEGFVSQVKAAPSQQPTGPSI